MSAPLLSVSEILHAPGKISMVGCKFGRLTVLRYGHHNKHQQIMWWCRCDCGNERAISGASLRNGRARSCGCIAREKSISIGQRFGRLVVRNGLHVGKDRNRHWMCQCDCGRTVVCHGMNLKRGHTQSCGCLRREVSARSPGGKIMPNHRAVLNKLYHAYARNCALKRKLDFELSRAQFETLVQQPCVYCGVTGSNVIPCPSCPEGFRYNGLDRVNNELGYIAANVVPCCWECNQSKLDRSKEAFISHAIRIVAWQSK